MHKISVSQFNSFNLYKDVVTFWEYSNLEMKNIFNIKLKVGGYVTQMFTKHGLLTLETYFNLAYFY